MADPIADLRQQLADHEADKDKRDTKMFTLKPFSSALC